MFLFDLFERHTNWDNRDYREYQDHRTRVKRRMRRRVFIGMALLVCVLFAVGLDTVNTKSQAKTMKPTEKIPHVVRADAIEASH